MPFATIPSSPQPRSTTIRPVNVVSKNTSAFTGATQTYIHSGKWWELVLEYPPISREDSYAWAAFFGLLEGADGTFEYEFPNSYAQFAGGYTLDGATHPAAGSTLLPIIRSDIFVGDQTLKAGNLFTLDNGGTGDLYMNLIDRTFAQDEEQSLSIWPPLRTELDNDTNFNYQNPKGVFQMIDDPDLQVNINKYTSFTITAKMKIEVPFEES